MHFPNNSNLSNYYSNNNMIHNYNSIPTANQYYGNVSQMPTIQQIPYPYPQQVRYPPVTMENDNEIEMLNYVDKLFEDKHFEHLYHYLETFKFHKKYHGHLKDLWNNAHYEEASMKGKLINSVARYRIRKKYPLPVTIWDGEETSYCFRKSSRKLLNDFFSMNPKPTADEKKYLAQEAGISLQQINNWFKNRRQRKRSIQSTQPQSSSFHVSTPSPKSQSYPTVEKSTNEINTSNDDESKLSNFNADIDVQESIDQIDEMKIRARLCKDSDLKLNFNDYENVKPEFDIQSSISKFDNFMKTEAKPGIQLNDININLPQMPNFPPLQQPDYDYKPILPLQPNQATNSMPNSTNSYFQMPSTSHTSFQNIQPYYSYPYPQFNNWN